jgi:hypothetical protein
VPSLRELNLCLLVSWVQRYYDANGKMWRSIVDQKYNSCLPNLFCCNTRNKSPFWKGVTWAAKVAKMGYRWHVGKGNKIRFWEDQWFGTCSLAIQYWGLYCIVSEQGATISEAWDGVNPLFTFRRMVNRETMDQ